MARFLIGEMCVLCGWLVGWVGGGLVVDDDADDVSDGRSRCSYDER